MHPTRPEPSDRTSPLPLPESLDRAVPDLADEIESLIGRLLKLLGTVRAVPAKGSPYSRHHFALTLKGWVARLGKDFVSVGAKVTQVIHLLRR